MLQLMDNFLKSISIAALLIFTSLVDISHAMNKDEFTKQVNDYISKEYFESILLSCDWVIKYNHVGNDKEYNALVFRARAIAYNGMNDFQNAIKNIDAAIDIDNKNFNNYNIKSDIHEKMGNYEKALQYIKEALEIAKGKYGVSDKVREQYALQKIVNIEPNIGKTKEEVIAEAKKEQARKVAQKAEEETEIALKKFNDRIRVLSANDDYEGIMVFCKNLTNEGYSISLYSDKIFRARFEFVQAVALMHLNYYDLAGYHIADAVKYDPTSFEYNLAASEVYTETYISSALQYAEKALEIANGKYGALNKNNEQKAILQIYDIKKTISLNKNDYDEAIQFQEKYLSVLPKDATNRLKAEEVLAYLKKTRDKQQQDKQQREEEKKQLAQQMEEETNKQEHMTRINALKNEEAFKNRNQQNNKSKKASVKISIDKKIEQFKQKTDVWGAGGYNVHSYEVKTLNITAIEDNIKIFGFRVNRGNCGGGDDEVNLKFGQVLSRHIINCSSVQEVWVNTNLGSWTFSFD